MTPKKIIKGSRVKITGKIPSMEGWWTVVKKDGTGLTCQRKTKGARGSTDQTWITEDQVSHVSNIKRKGKDK